MTPRPAIRVVLISRRPLLREGLAALLRVQPQIQLVGAASDPQEVAALDADIALWDAQHMSPQPLPFRFVALLGTPDQAQAWLGAGAGGVALETDSVEDLLTALREAARGETFVSPAAFQHLVTQLRSGSDAGRQDLASLTEREREVLRLLAQGLSNKAIAQSLYLSVRTVEGHLVNLYAKVRVRSRTEAALLAIQQGLTTARS